MIPEIMTNAVEFHGPEESILLKAWLTLSFLSNLPNIKVRNPEATNHPCQSFLMAVDHGVNAFFREHLNQFVKFFQVLFIINSLKIIACTIRCLNLNGLPGHGNPHKVEAPGSEIFYVSFV